MGTKPASSFSSRAAGYFAAQPPARARDVSVGASVMESVYFQAQDVEESSDPERTMAVESHTPIPLSPLNHPKAAIPLAAFAFPGRRVGVSAEQLQRPVRQREPEAAIQLELVARVLEVREPHRQLPDPVAGAEDAVHVLHREALGVIGGIRARRVEQR